MAVALLIVIWNPFIIFSGNYCTGMYICATVKLGYTPYSVHCVLRGKHIFFWILAMMVCIFISHFHYSSIQTNLML